MRFNSFSLVLVAALVAVGCENTEPAAAPAAAPGAVASKKAPEKAAPVAQAATQIESALKTAKRPFKRADVKVTDAQLEAIVASSFEVFETTEDPKVRVFVFHYDAMELVKPAKIARWINESGLIHNGQTSANRLRVIVAGTPMGGPIDEETTQVMNDFMDAFMVMR